MEIDIKRRVCDRCQNPQDSKGEVQYGGAPDFVEWLTVGRYVKPPHSFCFQWEPLHFCGATCLTEFFKEKA